MSLERRTPLRVRPRSNYHVRDCGYLSDCWVWRGKPDGSNGYGRVRIGGGKRKPAHVAFYEYFVGPVPDGLVLDHLCCVSLCVNPSHLEPVTGLINNRRRRWNRLNENAAAQIRARYAELTLGRERLPIGKLSELAAEFGCSRQAIMHVAKGRTWR